MEAHMNSIAHAAETAKLVQVQQTALERDREFETAIEELAKKAENLQTPESFGTIVYKFGQKLPFPVDGEIKRLLAGKHAQTNADWLKCAKLHLRRYTQEQDALQKRREAFDGTGRGLWNYDYSQMVINQALISTFQRLLIAACEYQNENARGTGTGTDQQDDPRINALKHWEDTFPLQMLLKEYDPRLHPGGKDFIISDMLALGLKSEGF